MVVPKPKDAKPFGSDSLVAMFVVLMAINMLAAIEFDHKLGFETREVSDIAAYGHLPTKAIPAELASA